ncbi:Hypp3992 [Branchiostoma lanceolatum]|uniref:Hypp3992 protein n=1 Tax=Branchiostoma lanceolatum TaxID=7740 RepID=A0A8K0EWA1_BRALA|nr:Hypp3992 [Branchiostoma lanceolatum]
MNRRRITVMGPADCRRKGKGCKEIHSNNVLIWSGVEQHQRAKHGVAFILHPDTAKNLTDTAYISERVIRMTIREKDRITNYIYVYAPCNDSYSDQEKDDFFEEVSDSLSQLLSLCAEHDLVIANTLFQHRRSHTQTWYRWNDLITTSQIDFILTRTTRRNRVHDARVIPNAGLDTDHRPVVMWIDGSSTKPHRRKVTPEEQINWHKFRKSMDIQEETRRKVTESLEHIDTNNMTASEAWCTFRDTLLNTVKKACGTKRQKRGQRKATVWWNDEVKEAVKEKKRLAEYPWPDPPPSNKISARPSSSPPPRRP